jgi:hypothetical protein
MLGVCASRAVCVCTSNETRSHDPIIIWRTEAEHFDLRKSETRRHGLLLVGIDNV